MGLSYRPMQVGDVEACVDIVAANPIQRRRYSSVLKHLPIVWSRLLGQESFRTDIFEASDSGPRRAVAVGVSVFVCDDFVQWLKSPPFVWIGPELTLLIVKGRSPLLSYTEVARQNSRGGLSAVVWTGCVHPQHSRDLQVHNLMVRAFIDQHTGFRLRELIAAQAESEEQLQAALNSGGLLYDSTHRTYAFPSREKVRGLQSKPHVLGITHDLATRQTGTWISELFHEYHEPRIRFNHSQQRLLVTATNGGTDVQLAKDLDISLATVKTTWRAIYGRVAERAPEILPPASAQDDSTTERGKTKKYHLLSYLRSHPEELRPIARKMRRA